MLKVMDLNYLSQQEADAQQIKRYTVARQKASLLRYISDSCTEKKTSIFLCWPCIRLNDYYLKQSNIEETKLKVKLLQDMPFCKYVHASSLPFFSSFFTFTVLSPGETVSKDNGVYMIVAEGGVDVHTVVAGLDKSTGDQRAILCSKRRGDVIYIPAMNQYVTKKEFERRATRRERLKVPSFIAPISTTTDATGKKNKNVSGRLDIPVPLVLNQIEAKSIRPLSFREIKKKVADDSSHQRKKLYNVIDTTTLISANGATLLCLNKEKFDKFSREYNKDQKISMMHERNPGSMSEFHSHSPSKDSLYKVKSNKVDHEHNISSKGTVKPIPFDPVRSSSSSVSSPSFSSSSTTTSPTACNNSNNNHNAEMNKASIVLESEDKIDGNNQSNAFNIEGLKKFLETHVVEYLRSIPFLKNVPPQKLCLLAEMCHYRYVDKGVFICHEGEDSNEVYIILDGSVDVLKTIVTSAGSGINIDNGGDSGPGNFETANQSSSNLNNAGLSNDRKNNHHINKNKDVSSSDDDDSNVNQNLRISQIQHYIKLNSLYSGAYFGEMSALLRCARTASIVAQEQCILIYIRRVDFRNFLALQPRLKGGIERELKKHLLVNFSKTKSLRYRKPQFQSQHQPQFQPQSSEYKYHAALLPLIKENTNPFYGVKEEELTALADAIILEETLGEGNVIIQEGDDVSGLYFIISGEVYLTVQEGERLESINLFDENENDSKSHSFFDQDDKDSKSSSHSQSDITNTGSAGKHKDSILEYKSEGDTEEEDDDCKDLDEETEKLVDRLGANKFFGYAGMMSPGKKEPFTVYSLSSSCVFLKFPVASFPFIFDRLPRLKPMLSLRYSGKNILLEEAMKLSFVKASFAAHLSKEYSRENLAFIDNVKKLKETFGSYWSIVSLVKTKVQEFTLMSKNNISSNNRHHFRQSERKDKKQLTDSLVITDKSLVPSKEQLSSSQIKEKINTTLSFETLKGTTLGLENKNDEEHRELALRQEEGFCQSEGEYAYLSDTSIEVQRIILLFEDFDRTLSKGTEVQFYEQHIKLFMRHILDILRLGQSIYERYISEKSLFPVNVPHFQRTNIEQHIKLVTNTVLEEAPSFLSFASFSNNCNYIKCLDWVHKCIIYFLYKVKMYDNNGKCSPTEVICLDLFHHKETDSVNFFDQAYNEIIYLLEKDNFYRYKSGEDFTHFLRGFINDPDYCPCETDNTHIY